MLNKDRAEKFVERMWPYLKNAKGIIDIGCGNGDISYLLLNRGKYVIPVDAARHNFHKGLKITLYDGVRLPFPDKSFDTAILSTVLHHTSDPEAILRDAARVAKNILVVETSYKNNYQRILTILFDSLVNFQLNFQPNSYKSDSDWRKLFEKLNLKVKSFSEYSDSNLGVSYIHYQYFLTPR